MKTTIPLSDLHLELQELSALLTMIAHAGEEHPLCIEASLLACVNMLERVTVAMEPWVDLANAQEGGAV